MPKRVKPVNTFFSDGNDNLNDNGSLDDDNGNNNNNGDYTDDGDDDDDGDNNDGDYNNCDDDDVDKDVCFCVTCLLKCEHRHHGCHNLPGKMLQEQIRTSFWEGKEETEAGDGLSPSLPKPEL